MNTFLDNRDRLRLHGLARQRAQVLRREAVPNFWRGARRLLDSLVQRLAPHAGARSSSASTLASGD